jgi:hypothetical protein
MGRKPHDEKQWSNFCSRLLLMLYQGADDDGGKPVRSIAREIEPMLVFLDESGIEPINNQAE